MASKKSDTDIVFAQKKEVLEIQIAYDRERHKQKMEELEMQKANDVLHHQMELERQRIKSAEIRKSMERKVWS